MTVCVRARIRLKPRRRLPQRLMMKMMRASRLLVWMSARRNARRRYHPFHCRFHPYYHSRYHCHRHHCHRRCDRFAERNTPTTMRVARADNRPTRAPAIAADRRRCAVIARQRLRGAKCAERGQSWDWKNRVCENTIFFRFIFLGE